MIEIPITIRSGAQAVRGFTGEMIGIDSRIEMMRKYTFANRLNCKSSASKLFLVDYLYLLKCHTWQECQERVSRSFDKVRLEEGLVGLLGFLSIKVKRIRSRIDRLVWNA